MIFDRETGLTTTKLSLFAGVIGLDTAKFDAELDSGPVKVAVQNDVTGGQKFVTRFIPTLFVDGKYVERWKREATTSSNAFSTTPRSTRASDSEPSGAASDPVSCFLINPSPCSGFLLLRFQ